ncbi:unnamed protein product [Rotaria magnacalcarata]|uniref:Uncharacterized protein n=1 Tax=Rotaria magnacalcarata TaxID=392030 RepID=A0A816M3H9_9BILA|nr:unnamed protein product [Rotaria magnacalcarata]
MYFNFDYFFHLPESNDVKEEECGQQLALIEKHLDNHELFHIAGNSEDIEFNDKTNIIVQGEKSQNFLSTQRKKETIFTFSINPRLLGTVQISKKSEPNQSPIKSSSFGTIH